MKFKWLSVIYFPAAALTLLLLALIYSWPPGGFGGDIGSAVASFVFVVLCVTGGIEARRLRPQRSFSQKIILFLPLLITVGIGLSWVVQSVLQ